MNVDLREIPLSNLVLDKDQIRTGVNPDYLGELASSIDAIGQLSPILVADSRENGKYEILNGHRRFLACQQLGRETITCIVLAHASDEEIAAIRAAVSDSDQPVAVADLEKLARIDKSRRLVNKGRDSA